MNRRELFGVLVATPAATRQLAGRSVPQIEPERALSFVHPSCPRCGAALFFTRRSAFVGDLVPVECYAEEGNCGCGWKGVSPVAK